MCVTIAGISLAVVLHFIIQNSGTPAPEVAQVSDPVEQQPVQQEPVAQPEPVVEEPEAVVEEPEVVELQNLYVQSFVNLQRSIRLPTQFDLESHSEKSQSDTTRIIDFGDG